MNCDSTLGINLILGFFGIYNDVWVKPNGAERVIGLGVELINCEGLFDFDKMGVQTISCENGVHCECRNACNLARF